MSAFDAPPSPQCSKLMKQTILIKLVPLLYTKKFASVLLLGNFTDKGLCLTYTCMTYMYVVTYVSTGIYVYKSNIILYHTVSLNFSQE
jgi:hypothetical protein